MEGIGAGPMSWTCDGAAWNDMGAMKSGTWTGHICAGLVLLVWALHWNAGVYKAWLVQTKQRPYRAQTTYPVPLIPPSWPVEAVLKVLIPLGAIFANLIGADGWRSNACTSPSPREGHFDPLNVARYANVWILVSVLVSGLVDILARFVELPSGTQQFFTSMAFMLQAFILSEGQHPDMLAGNVYYLLYLVSAGAAMFMLAEIVWPHSIFTSCGRVYCTYLAAIWYFAAARILYEGRTAWNTREPLPDMAPAAFAAVPFVFWMNFTSLFMFLAYLLMRWLLRAQLDDTVHEVTAQQPVMSRHSDSPVKEPRSTVAELVPLVSRHV